LKRVPLVTSTRHKCPKIQLRRTTDLRLRENLRKDICSRIFLESRRMSPRKMNLRKKSKNQLLFKYQNQRKRKEVFLTISLELPTQIQPNLSHQDSHLPESHSHSKTSTTKR
jgi:hypothetical protein